MSSAVAALVHRLTAPTACCVPAAIPVRTHAAPNAHGIQRPQPAPHPTRPFAARLRFLAAQVISGVVTLALFAGVGYYFLTQSGKGDDAVDVTPSSSSGKKGGSGGGKDLDDPLSEARRIMDKYK